MKKTELQPIIKALEKATNSKVVVYCTNDLRAPFNTQVGSDIMPFLKKVLKKGDVVRNLTLILHTNGGALDAVWPFLHALRTYTTETLRIIVPSKALSAGTLIALGADMILMSKVSFLSAIDPAGVFISCIGHDGKPETKQCAVEDIMGFIDFAKHKIGLKNQVSLTEILKIISNEYNPSIIGSVNRTHSLIRSLAVKIMGLRAKGPGDKLSPDAIKKVSQKLIEEIYSHQHLINIDEARELGITYAQSVPDEWVALVDKIFDLYANELYLEDCAVNLDSMISANIGKPIRIIGAVLHCYGLQYNFESNVQVDPDGKVHIFKRGWEKL